ncbi:ATP-grasp domain-containing protein [Corynebacterium lubricantis]|uniref:ATP-grasp domain-containing protein n=1 Tax=Corynebacterium lubricantis TaxID=541095 RepID=UPI000370468C|nr:RimK family alpha-L-glutamate ligase [Corynebacterium lubricantis]
MSHGWIVVNHFYSSPKFDELHTWLERSAERAGLDARLITNAEVQPTLAHSTPDWVLFWDKDVHMARRIEATGVRCFNSAAAIEACDDKYFTYVSLLDSTVAQPETWLVPLRFTPVQWHDEPIVDEAIAALGLPLVAKESFGSFGAQVHLMHSREDLVAWLDQLGNRAGLLQKFVEAAAGRDLRLQVVGSEVVSTIERTAADGEFRANLTHGGTARTITPTEAQREAALKASAHLGLDFAGVDLLIDADGTPVVCEVNSNAHFVNMSRTTGVDIGDAIMAYIREQTTSA